MAANFSTSQTKPPRPISPTIPNSTTLVDTSTVYANLDRAISKITETDPSENRPAEEWNASFSKYGARAKVVGEKIADAAGSVKPTISLKDPKDKVYNDLEKAISKITEIDPSQKRDPKEWNAGFSKYVNQQ